MTALDIAMRWLHSGISVLPIRPHSKYPLISWREYQERLPYPTELIRWFGLNDNLNLAVVCGPISNDLMIIDFDSLVSFLEFKNEHPELIDTFTVQSARGFHLYYHCPNPPAQSALGPKIDVKSNGYVLCPPSIHENGKQYTVVNDAEIMKIDRLLMCEDSPSIWLGGQRVTFNNCTVTINVNGGNDSIPPNTRGINVHSSFIRTHYPITRIFPDYQLSGNQNYAMAHCPGNHKNGDRHPSLQLDLQTNRCSCYKSDCPYYSPDRWLGVIDAYMIRNELSFFDAICQMAKELDL